MYSSPGSKIGNLASEYYSPLGIVGTDPVPIGASLIDAHSGALGMLACIQARDVGAPETQLGLICGTSSCHMVLSR